MKTRQAIVLLASIIALAGCQNPFGKEEPKTLKFAGYTGMHYVQYTANVRKAVDYSKSTATYTEDPWGDPTEAAFEVNFNKIFEIDLAKKPAGGKIYLKLSFTAPEGDRLEYVYARIYIDGIEQVFDGRINNDLGGTQELVLEIPQK